ncbi:MAG: hypothetical protein ISP71_03650 [Flavobacteriales bacterium]|nr:hypothetical protein [Flavobacteriales bacterium]
MKYIALILIGILTACSSSTFEQEQEQVNAVIIQYDSLLQSVENIDISSAGSNLKRYKEALAYSKTKLSTDKKPSLETMTYLNDLKLMKRQFKNAPNQKNGFVTNIIRNQEQLQNLLSDIDNAIFTKEELNAIIVREEQALEGISIQLNEFQSAYKNYEIRFDSLEQLSQTFNYQ